MRLIIALIAGALIFNAFRGDSERYAAAQRALDASSEAGHELALRVQALEERNNPDKLLERAKSLEARLEKLEGARQMKSAPVSPPVPPKVKTVLEAAQDEAREQGKKLFVIFTQSDAVCPACRELSHGALADKRCMAQINEKLVVRIVKSEERPELFSQFNIGRTPSGLIFFPQSNEWGTPFPLPSSSRALLAKLFGEPE